MNDNQKRLADLIKNSHRITVLTGAGISTESGIPDFRSSNGVWTQDVKREDLMSTWYMQGHPKKFWPAYKDIFKIKLARDYKPNIGHTFLAELEQAGKQVTVLTQNVDGLHTEAGSSTVYEIHGSMRSAHCPKCKTEYGLEHVMEHEIPRCTRIKGLNEDGSPKYCNFILEPNVVLFGGQIYHMDEAVLAAENSDLFMVLGSSLQVSPVNTLPRYAWNSRRSTRRSTTEMVIVNREPTGMDYMFDLKIHDGIGDTFQAIQEYIL